jgi:hypothetical protein
LNIASWGKLVNPASGLIETITKSKIEEEERNSLKLGNVSAQEKKEKKPKTWLYVSQHKPRT